MIIYPKFLKKNDTIGITATSSGIEGEEKILRLENAYKNINKLGLNLTETPSVRQNTKFTSNSAEVRADEFLNLWNDENISAIAQIRGGEFLMETLPYLDKKIIQSSNPKWLTGYSDSSLLNFYITTNFNIATATAQNILHFGMKKLDKSLINQINILQGKTKVQKNYDKYELNYNESEDPYYLYNTTEKVEYKSLYNNSPITIKGRLIGGCIDVISNITGTKYDNTVKFCKQFKEGMLWYLENCELSVLELYRTLWRMKESGWFNNANGIIIGRTRGNIQVKDFTYLDALHKAFDDLNIPVIYDVDFGHVLPQWTMINGSFATFEYKKGKGKIIQELI